MARSCPQSGPGWGLGGGLRWWRRCLSIFLPTQLWCRSCLSPPPLPHTHSGALPQAPDSPTEGPCAPAKS